MAMFIPAIIDIAGKIFDKVIPDKGAAEKAKAEFFAAAQEHEFALMLEQIKVNQAEAGSTNWFVAGWRPFVGWICGAGLAYVAILEPVARFLAEVIFGYKGAFPVIDTTLTMQVLLGMLGLAAARSIEKVKGAEGNR